MCEQPMTTRPRRVFDNLLPALILMSFGYLVYRIAIPDPLLVTFHQAVIEFESQNHAKCLALCEDLLSVNPDFRAARLLKGQSHSRNQEWNEAVQEFRRVAPGEDRLSSLAEFGLAEFHYFKGRHDLAESHLRRCLKINSRNLKANRRLAYILQIQARTWESLPFVMELVRQGQFRADELVMLGTPHALWVEDKDQVRVFESKSRPHSMLTFGPLREAVQRNSDEDILTPLHRVIEENPEQTEPLILLGEIHLRTGQRDRIEQWIREYGEQLKSHPQFWYLCGQWAQTIDERTAARCQLTAQKCSPRHFSSAYQLSQLDLGSSSQRNQRFSRKAIADSEIDFLLFELRSSLDRLMIQKVVSLLMQEGRFWEATAWCELLLRFHPDERWAIEAYHRSRAELNSEDFDDRLYALANESIAAGLKPAELSDLEALIHRPADRRVVAPPNLAPSEGSTIAFRELGQAAGLDFQYFNGTTPEIGLEHIIQATGGAVAVLDYDQDGWPDIYCAQSGEWPVDPSTNPYRNRLFRNLGDERFEDVTEHAGLSDGHYSQGTAVGDLNHDGFPDLFLSNIGPNLIYWNNGDGTFTESMMPGESEQATWSMSAAMADLNRDGLLDLYVVNYLKLQAVLDRACKSQGLPRGCSPTMFDGEQDRVWLNLGNGSFRDVTREWGFEHEGGKGLGIIAADFDGDSDIEIFVGNDTCANFYFDRTGGTSRDRPRYENLGILMGVGLDSDGKAQASMGIAAGDLNRDGTLDLFITNFYGDANILYTGQSASRGFQVSTRQANLFQSGFHLLGFGTQALDLERDGDLDLIVLNGHIDRTFATGEPDRMPPQVLLNSNSTFHEIKTESLGDYFQGQYFGRSLSLLDANRDGLTDCAVSHLDAPARILLNQSIPQNGFLKIQLTGTNSCRWPVGTTLRFFVGDSQQTAWITSGDGYLSSNEHLVNFSHTGENDIPARLEVDWPAGTKSVYENVPENRELRIIEGKDQFILMDNPIKILN